VHTDYYTFYGRQIANLQAGTIAHVRSDVTSVETRELLVLHKELSNGDVKKPIFPCCNTMSSISHGLWLSTPWFFYSSMAAGSSPKYSAQFDGDLVSASMKMVRIAVSAVNRCEDIRK
jgi:hypothetical protein